MLPVGDSALDYLQRAAALSPDDPIILEFRPELAEAIAASALDVLESGDVDDAELRIEAARSLGAAPEPLAALDAEVAAIREAAAEEAVAARQAALLTDGRARLTSGQYFEPADDSAFFYLTSLSTENPGYPELDAAWQEFADGLESSAIEAIDSADWAAGESWLDQLLRVDPESERVAELRAELEAARLQEEFLTVVTPPSDLVLLDSEPPVYPADAVVSSTEGWVDLEFVLGRDGNVTDISVIAAEPVGEFEEAAMEALSTYRFEPFELDGRIYERRIGFRMRFALQ
jgi:TonB family protein